MARVKATAIQSATATTGVAISRGRTEPRANPTIAWATDITMPIKGSRRESRLGTVPLRTRDTAGGSNNTSQDRITTGNSALAATR